MILNASRRRRDQLAARAARHHRPHGVPRHLSGVKDGKRNFLRIALAALRMPRICVLKLFDANTGIYALNALHVLRDPTWIAKLTVA